MSEDQYKECKKYEGIINLFKTSGQYIGGADSLFDYYKMQGQERSCPSCVSRFLLERYGEIERYERNM